MLPVSTLPGAAAQGLIKLEEIEGVAAKYGVPVLWRHAGEGRVDRLPRHRPIRCDVRVVAGPQHPVHADPGPVLDGEGIGYERCRKELVHVFAWKPRQLGV